MTRPVEAMTPYDPFPDSPLLRTAPDCLARDRKIAQFVTISGNRAPACAPPRPPIMSSYKTHALHASNECI
ncbi:hypothetical protein EVAR_39813_1 [Eumeta japonica]|uniref:Uncharacterized protein n=1 Tax=Eumeta variegata TaxID=151549 RepID=A0A4C1X790_EUMVA|nr:hypothetical protein EVAR_39813_1 [Eumeta japonica]